MVLNHTAPIFSDKYVNSNKGVWSTIIAGDDVLKFFTSLAASGVLACLDM